MEWLQMESLVLHDMSELSVMISIIAQFSQREHNGVKDISAEITTGYKLNSLNYTAGSSSVQTGSRAHSASYPTDTGSKLAGA
jgi:hypothetical protein